MKFKKLWLKEKDMDNKMSSTAKFCKDKNFLKISQAKTKIKSIKREIKDFKECFNKMDGYGIEITQNSFIKFVKEEDYKNLLKIEDQIRKLYENLLKGKCSKKYICKNIDTIKKNLNKGDFEEIVIFYNPFKRDNPFYIKFPFVCFYEDDEKRDNFIYNIGKFKDEKLKDKSIDFAYYLQKHITIHHFEKERSLDLYELNRDIGEIEVKSDIISILKRIDEYLFKVESDFYADMEQKQYEKNQREKAR